MYWLDPDGGSHSNAFLAYCDMTSFNKAWTMCYTTDDKAKPKTEVTYSAQIPYGTDGYRTNCNNIPVSSLAISLHPKIPQHGLWCNNCLTFSRTLDYFQQRKGGSSLGREKI